MAYTEIPAGGGGSGVTLQWRQQAFAYARTQYATLDSDFLVDFDRGSTGDYGTNNVAATGVANLNSGFNGGVITADTGANANSTIGVAPLGTPTIVASTKNSPPWMLISRAKFFGTVDSQFTCYPVAITPSGSPASAFTVLGIRGSSSTAFLTLAILAGGATVQVTTQAVDTTQLIDFGVGFDGTTVQAYYGQIMAGTFTTVASGSITDLTNMNTSTGMPMVYVGGGTLASSRGVSNDTLWMAYKRS